MAHRGPSRIGALLIAIVTFFFGLFMGYESYLALRDYGSPVVS